MNKGPICPACLEERNPYCLCDDRLVVLRAERPEVVEALGLEGNDDKEFRSRQGMNLDELAEHLSKSEMTADIGGIKRSVVPAAGIEGDDDNAQLIVGRLIPANAGHPSPHAPRDKTEEWDMKSNPVASPTILSVKDTNPKDAVGTKKWRQYCTVPTTILWELGVAMLEGARKYGRHNYRIAGVRASVYVDAAKGHIDQWWEGEDIDEESKLNHLVKAIASLVVLRDAMIQGKWVDDRPPKTDLDSIRKNLQEAVDSIFERIPEAKDAFLEGDQYED